MRRWTSSNFLHVTPNQRLSQALASVFDRAQIAKGLKAWEAADILPFTAFVERAFDDALYSDLAAGLPSLLTPDEEQQLWEEVIRADRGRELLAVPETAALARDAWQLAHAWALLPALKRHPHDDDAQAFAEWSRRYLKRTNDARLTDRARLPGMVAGLFEHASVKKPALLVAYGFDIVTPQQQALFEAYRAQGAEFRTCGPRIVRAQAMRIACADAREEIRQAARWARARLEADATARIGVVVPDLGKRKDAIRRVFAQTMLPGGGKHTLPFNISLGDPLGAWPLAAHALLVLELAGREIEFERASLLVRSPFLAAGDAEAQVRAKLDAALRRRAEPAITLERLVPLASDAPVLARKLAALAEFRKARLFAPQSPGAWGRAFSEALELVGFPGERQLDSDEYQTLVKWHELLAQFVRLERVTAKMGFGEALARLKRMAGEALFQPETPEVPVQVLGVLEASGLEFDHLWVMGLQDESWPLAPRTNPFLPLALQRDSKVPNATPAESLALARRLTAEWLGCAGEVVLSHPLREDERMLAASPLIADVPIGSLESPRFDAWRDAIHRTKNLVRAPDTRGPALAAGEPVSGGAAVIADHAACPFRAFAVHRLCAEGIEAPHAGLDARERGMLVHRVLAAAWGELKTRHALEATTPAALGAILGRAADEAIARARRDRPTILAGRFAAIEKQRLMRLARDWLSLELGRGEFTVVVREDKRALEIGGLRLNVRLDRMDETAAGERIVIDYKTGEAKLASMLGERPDQPQLPLYLIASEPDAAGVAFAQVRAGGMKFTGLARADDLLPGVKMPEKAGRSGAGADWEQQVASWRAEIERLARGFAEGDAPVDPKRALQTCEYCDVKPLCRIYERLANTLEEGE
jgi:probable DNA repair protein